MYHGVGCSEEAHKIVIHAIFDNYVKKFKSKIKKTGDIEIDGDALYNAICTHFDLSGPVLDDECSEAEAIIINGKKALGVGLQLTGADLLMELCFQHFS